MSATGVFLQMNIMKSVLAAISVDILRATPFEPNRGMKK